jgi:hypothetical protein
MDAQPLQLKIEKTFVIFQGESLSQGFACDTIFYKGRLWLVPEWTRNQAKGTSKPRRIIALGAPFFAYSNFCLFADADYQLAQPIQRDVYEGRAPFLSGGENAVVENPDIEVATTEGLN